VTTDLHPVGTVLEVAREYWHPNFGTYMTTWYVGEVVEHRNGMYVLKLPSGEIMLAGQDHGIKVRVSKQ
jgi:hypothetical protein